jgi:hypothetical protein
VQTQIRKMTNVEIVGLRVRVIALENGLISLLATAPDHQLQLIREMADYISPRRGCAPHPLTIHAAEHMVGLVDRSMRFRSREAGATTATKQASPAPSPDNGQKTTAARPEKKK